MSMIIQEILSILSKLHFYRWTLVLETDSRILFFVKVTDDFVYSVNVDSPN